MLYAAADVSFPRRRGKVIRSQTLEAMRAGLPVVAYSVGGIPEQVEESRTGYLVQPGALGELAARVSLLAKSEGLCRRMGEAGRARQSGQFGLATMLNSTEDSTTRC